MLAAARPRARTPGGRRERGNARLEPIAQGAGPARQPRSAHAPARRRARSRRCRADSRCPAASAAPGRRPAARPRARALAHHERADPLRPPSLWADRVRKSTPSALRSIGSLPAACTASQWTSAPWRWATSTTSRTGWITPVSLLASMTETSAGSSGAPARQLPAARPALGIHGDARRSGPPRAPNRARRRTPDGAADAAQRLVVGFGAAAREHHRVRRAPTSAATARGRARARAAPRGRAMHRRGIAGRAERLDHGLDHRRLDRRVACSRGSSRARRGSPEEHAQARRCAASSARPRGALAGCRSSCAIRAFSSSSRSVRRSITRDTGSIAAPGAVP